MLDLKFASLPDIAAHYQSPVPNWVRANMVVSRDDHFVGPTKSSRDLTGDTDFNLLLLLRALSDVVLVGANTARIENYRQPKERAGFAFLNRKPPRLAVVSSSLDFDLSAPLFSGGLEQTLILNAGRNTPSSDLLDVAQVVNLPQVDNATSENFGLNLIAQLADLGLFKITCEGGPSLLTQLLNANAVDEYDLTVSPINVGGSASWSSALPSHENWELVGSAVSGDFEFKRLLLRR